MARFKVFWAVLLLTVSVIASGCSLLSKGEPVSPKPHEYTDDEPVRDFSGEKKQDGFPVGWESKYASGQLGKHIFFELDLETDEWILKLHRDPGDSAAIVVQSDPIPVTPGIDYIALAEVRSENGASARMHIEYLDEKGNRIEPVPSQEVSSDTWVLLGVNRVAPSNAVWGRMFFFLHHTVDGTSYFRNPEFLRF